MKPGLMMDILAQQNADLRKRTGAGQTGGNLLLGGPGQDDADGDGRGVGGASRYLRNPEADARRASAGPRFSDTSGHNRYGGNKYPRTYTRDPRVRE